MKRQYSLILFVSVLVLIVGCKKEKETRTIIEMDEQPSSSSEPKAMDESVVDKSFNWGSDVYRVVISRIPDKEVVVKDEDGNKYFDNTIQLCLDGPKGTVFERVFKKGDFTSYVNSDYLKPKRSALMGIVFNRVDGGNAIFVVSVGSPDEMADEFMYIQLAVSKSGAISMSRLQDIETASAEDTSLESSEEQD